MPSLAAVKIDKISTADAADPVKQIMNMVEKKARNLEKRKMKLDNYRLDVKNGKELNEDQKIAVSKYDTVEGLLEFSKEISKAINSIMLENTRQQKKLAKKEQLERQQYEIQRLQEAFMFRHILSSFQNEEVRNDFLNGENGAVQLTSEQLSQLDQLFKLIAPGLPIEQADLSSHFHALAENHIFLVEGKNKEIVGTTYKVLKDLLQSIKDCKYFSQPSETVEEDGTSSEDIAEDEMLKNEEIPEALQAASEDSEPLSSAEQCIIADEVIDSVVMPEATEEIQCNNVPQFQNGPLQDVLSSQTSFNFLQESQIDLGAPHMDPAVVAVHQMAPPPPASVNFPGSSYPTSPPLEDKPLVNASENCDLSNQATPVNQVPMMSSAMPRNVAPVSAQLNSQQEFDLDPSHPIPTQTFTNQSFAVMQNMIMPQGYVPVTMHHGHIPPHIASIPVVPGLSPPATSGTSVMPIPVPATPASVTPVVDNHVEMEPKIVAENSVKPVEDDALAGEIESSSNNVSEKNENGYNQSFRGGYRRGRGRGNGYFRGRPNFNGRGGYQNNYYHDRNGYNGNYRRGNNRGPRGGNGNNNNRGRGNYRTPASSQPPQQQQQQSQQ